MIERVAWGVKKGADFLPHNLRLRLGPMPSALLIAADVGRLPRRCGCTTVLPCSCPCTDGEMRSSYLYGDSGGSRPEERHRIYKLLWLSVRSRPDWPLEVSGIFAEVAEEAENGLSYCNFSSGSFLDDEPPTLKFRALLTEDGAGQLDVMRV
jgi:hypothetical protein